MVENRLAQLQAVDLAILTEVVRQDLGRPDLEIGAWSARMLSNKGIANPDGLWLVSGEGRDAQGACAWSLVVKMVRRQVSETPESHREYWRREPLLAQSGLAHALPGRLRAPRFYRVDETADGAWLWMEHVAETRPGPWTLDDYAFAARVLGRWNGEYLSGKPLPKQPWLMRNNLRDWLGDNDPAAAWDFPLHAKYLSDGTRARCERLWAERETYLQALDALPQAWSHFDCQRRNLFIRQGPDQANELVLVDWALCGLGPVGAEPVHLALWTCVLCDWPGDAVEALAAAVWVPYLEGLTEAGWRGDPKVVRLAYAATAALGFGAVMPGGSAWWCAPEQRTIAVQLFGAAEEALYVQYLPLLTYALDRADEARALM